MQYLGDFAEDATVVFDFNVFDANGEPVALTGTLTEAVEIYKSGSSTPHTAKYTPAVLNSLTGVYRVTVDMSAHAFFVAGVNYAAVLTGAGITADGVAVTNTVLRTWSCANRTAKVVDGSLTADSFATGVLATEADVADAVWDEARADHTDADSFGEGVNVYAMTTNAGSSIRTAVGMASANLDSQLATIDTNVDSILVDTGTTLDTKINSILDDTGTAGVVVAAASIASIATDAAKKLGIPMTLSGTPTTTSLPVSDAPTGISTTQLDNALVLHLPSGSYSRVTEVAGSVPNLTLTVSPAYPAAPDASDEIVVFGQYLASL